MVAHNEDIDTRISADIKQLLDKLGDVSAQLNAVSDHLTASINVFEKQIKSLNLGVHASVTVHVAQALGSTVFTLSHTHVEGKWGLYVSQNADSLVTWQLSSAPRELRMRSVLVFPDLLIALETAARVMIIDIEHATSRAEAILAAIRGD